MQFSRFLFLSIVWVAMAVGQEPIVLRGVVQDSASGEFLPVANIQVEGTYQGAITNRDGQFQLPVESLPVTLVIRYIGYETGRVEVRESGTLVIRLRPLAIQMREVVITGEDPAVGIMREVIRRKKIWQAKLNTFHADSYSRLNFGKDTVLGGVAEQLSDLYWKRDKGIREVLKSKRHTANLDQVTFSLSQGEDGSLLNFYDDDIQIQGSRFVGPTHPDAFDYYDFRLMGEQRTGDQNFFVISVQPTTKLQPVFIGQIRVSEEHMALVDIELKPADHVTYPIPIQRWGVEYKQQFSMFANETWLPLGMHVEGQIKIAMPGIEFPNIRYNMMAGFSNFEINATLPDSIYRGKRLVFADSTSLKDTTLFESAGTRIPLSEDEQTAYTTLTKQDKIEKIFKPTGMLSRFVQMDDGEPDSTKRKSFLGRMTKGVSPDLKYNRVEGGHLGIAYEQSLSKTLKVKIRGGYMTALEEGFYGFRAGWIHSRKNDRIDVEGSYGIETRYPSDAYAEFVASFQPLTGYRDYFDYYRVAKGSLSGTHFVRAWDTRFGGGVRVERHRSVAEQTNFDLFGRRYIQRVNPPVKEGDLRSIFLRVRYGNDHVPAAPSWQNGIVAEAEFAPSQIPGNDFKYARYQCSLNWRFPTFLTRRFLPNVLDVRLVASTYTGKLPIQRWSSLDGSLGYFTPTATFRTLRSRPLEGEKSAAIFWEHHFRSLPFEWIGWESATRKGYGFIAFGGHGRTWIKETTLQALSFAPSYQNEMYHELGLSLNGVFSLFRIDAAYRMGRDRGMFYGLSVAKIF